MSVNLFRRPAPDESAPRPGVRRSWPVVAGAAVLIAVSTTGGAVAGGMVTGEKIKNYTISQKDLRTGAADSRVIADGAVRSADLAAEVVSGLKGATGEKGTTGAAGATGPTGPRGETGARGPAGVDGTNGVDGTDGTDGANGANGQGVPTGGTAGQVLSKIDGTSYNTRWTSLPDGVELLVDSTATGTTSIPGAQARSLESWSSTFDPGGLLGDTTGRFTAPSTGIYQFELSAAVSNASGDARSTLQNLGTFATTYGDRSGDVSLRPSPRTTRTVVSYSLAAGEVVIPMVEAMSNASVEVASGAETKLRVMRLG